MIGLFYRIFDTIVMRLLALFVDIQQVRVVLRDEILSFSGREETANYELEKNLTFANHVDIINARVSTLLTHISIMIAILFFAIQGYDSESFFRLIISVELWIYLVITVLCLRCMRSYGFEKKHSPERYNVRALEDLVVRFSIFRFCNFLTMILTLVFVGILIYKPPIENIQSYFSGADKENLGPSVGTEVSGESQIVDTGEGSMDTTAIQTTMDAWEFYISVLTPLISAVTLAVLVGIFLYDRRRNKNEGTYNHNLAWQGFNQVFTDKAEFIDFERKLHPFEDLSREDMLRVYYWFMRFNVVYRAHRSKTHKTMAEKLGQSSWANEVNLSFGDRDFIRRNVFPRGYDNDLAKAFEAGWKQIEDGKKTLPMAGAPASSGVTPIYNADFLAVDLDESSQDLIAKIMDGDADTSAKEAAFNQLMEHQEAIKSQVAKTADTGE